ncbi:Bacterial DnaG primase, TOPRIM domain [uncultured Caudovirales phage]|uniref:Bacterial DnaG primase, TOPRIM domain n=1 Tax=uncultured Caudovirales phage TaxID=2100421 RepID=A0A6J5L2I9_9CAUD|nr:Bacterial DnaG primase, TOPRIM domain [uncultured Caudovirales phage]CAB5219696.1 Bacterial DnaG primase, TOPRIM domain [uncultured Caudovirales phage]
MINTIDVPKVLNGLGIEYEEKTSDAQALCPMHLARTGKEDMSPSWWINLESGLHICFSCGYKGNLPQLVCDVNEFYLKTWDESYQYDYPAAEAWISQVAEISMETLLEIMRNLPSRIDAAPKPLEMSEARLAVFVSPPKEQLDVRNITEDAAKTYGILWDAKKKAWVLPLRAHDSNKLLGWQEKGTEHRTFFNRPAGLQKSKTLFGIENQNEQTAIVVESPLDCVRLASAGINGAVAVCGSNVSEEQVKLLRASSKIIVAFDNPKVDKAGAKASKEILEFGRKYGLNLFFFNYGDTCAKDPGDMTDDELRWGVENAKSSILGEQAYV